LFEGFLFILAELSDRLNWGRSGDDLGDGLFFLGFADFDDIGVRSLRTDLSGGVMRKHNFDLKSDNSLSEEDVSDSGIDVLGDWVSGVDHKSVSEFHGLGSLTSQFTRDDDLTTLGSRLHDEAENTIGSTSDGQTSHELVSERFALSDSTETTVGDFLGKKFDLTLFHLESFLDESGQLPNALSLVTKDILGSGGEDDNLSSLGGNADFDSRVTVLGELLAKESVELGFKNSFSDVLALL